MGACGRILLTRSRAGVDEAEETELPKAIAGEARAAMAGPATTALLPETRPQALLLRGDEVRLESCQ